jgi:hypothetical protein
MVFKYFSGSSCLYLILPDRVCLFGGVKAIPVPVPLIVIYQSFLATYPEHLYHVNTQPNSRCCLFISARSTIVQYMYV